MAKISAVIITLILCFSIMSLSVFAAGGGGGGHVTPKPIVKEPVPTETAPIDCERKATVFDRVKCRLMNGNEESKVHESCRGLSNEAECQKLYDAVYPCYSSKGKEKDRCFRKVAGFERLNSMTQQQKNNYALFMLYDLEERVEDAYKDGKINEYRTANLVAKIIEVKKTILENKERSETKSKLLELKQIWTSEVQ